MIVAGGTYVERCVAPFSDQLMGSGGRATLALPPSVGAVLHTFHPDPEDVRANFGASAVVHPVDDVVSFDYLHPLSKPRISPVPLPVAERIEVAGDAIIRFGCLEGDFRVDAGVAVYDPQNGGRSRLFRANGSRAQRLALVLNAGEAAGLAGGGLPVEAGAALLDAEAAQVVVVKDGPAGAMVIWNGGFTAVPAYRTDSIFKIGSGDVFTAMFALHWALEGMDPVGAADLASKKAAAYVSNRTLPCPSDPPPAEPVSTSGIDHALLVVDGQDVAAAWLVDEARQALSAIGARNIRTAPWTTTDADQAAVLLAVAREPEGIALTTARAAKAAGVPTVVFAERPEVVAEAVAAKLTILADFASAVYAAAWCAR